ncbi:hypothetical protein [Nocardioides sp. CFH 31398]|uniref:hypothetical protein n=1 Tax=Nocardioides sp. CFH 31398 TaxID=2919579 RepID=UPI001F069295|nr:hypothetical protein [Nocardioides sp. CFH 31398]MCH1868154.1 hypothetical protein [Nocardioides sp. CFH 31398]
MIALVNDLATVAWHVLADVPAPGGVEQGPPPEDVKAGWTAFAIFFGLCGVVALLCWSFVRQIAKTRRARDAGVFGDPPDAGDARDRTPRGASSDQTS